MDKRQLFVELAKKVPDVYPDFVFAMEVEAKNQPDNVINDMVEFLQNNPSATSSDVLEKLADYIPFEEQYEKGVDDSFFDDEDGLPFYPFEEYYEKGSDDAVPDDEYGRPFIPFR